MTLCDLARQRFTSSNFVSYDDMKKRFTQEYNEYDKTPYEWMKEWTELKFRPDTDNFDEYIQKFQDLSTLLTYPEEHQVQFFKMRMPENIELRIRDITTLHGCIEEAKVCLTICQPSSLISRMTTLTVAPSDISPPVINVHLLPCEELSKIYLPIDKIDKVQTEVTNYKEIHISRIQTISR